MLSPVLVPSSCVRRHRHSSATAAAAQHEPTGPLLASPPSRSVWTETTTTASPSPPSAVVVVVVVVVVTAVVVVVVVVVVAAVVVVVVVVVAVRRPIGLRGRRRPQLSRRTYRRGGTHLTGPHGPSLAVSVFRGSSAAAPAAAVVVVAAGKKVSTGDPPHQGGPLTCVPRPRNSPSKGWARLWRVGSVLQSTKLPVTHRETSNKRGHVTTFVDQAIDVRARPGPCGSLCL